MGGSTTQPTQTTRTEISPQAAQLFDLAYPNLRTFAASPPPQQYPGSSVAGFTPEQTQAQQMALTAAQQQQMEAARASSLAGQVPGMLQWGINPAVQPTPTMSSNIFTDQGIWNPQYNVGLREAIGAVQRPIYENLTQTALPAIRQQALSTGPFGGSRQELAEGRAVAAAGETATDAARRMVQELYGQNLQAAGTRYGQNLQGALTARGQDITGLGQQYGQNLAALYQNIGLAPMLQGAWAQPAATTGAVGDVQQAMSQAQLTDQINRYNYEQWAPFLQSREIMSLIPSMPGAQNISTANTPQVNPYMQALGGAASGAALGSMAGPFGTAAGALGGAVLPFLFR